MWCSAATCFCQALTPHAGPVIVAVQRTVMLPMPSRLNEIAVRKQFVLGDKCNPRANMSLLPSTADYAADTRSQAQI